MLARGHLTEICQTMLYFRTIIHLNMSTTHALEWSMASAIALNLTAMTSFAVLVQWKQNQVDGIQGFLSTT